MIRPERERLLFMVIVALCAFTRLWDLGARGIMHDESLFVYYTYEHLHKQLTYTYMPILHGPAMLWLQAGVFHVFGTSDYTMRLGVGLLGIAGLWWIRALRPWIGPVGVLVACAFYTLSPSLMFYQRFFRNDGLFIFTNLWIVASALHWWRGRHPGWLASFVVAVIILFCNMESCVFLYFSLATFLALLVVHDLAAWILDDRRSAAIPARVAPPQAWATALVLFGGFTLFLTRVLEGISYEQSVVDAIGRNFALKDVRSVALALGISAPVESAGALGQPMFWRIFYVLLAAGSVSAGVLLQLAVARSWGESALLARLWSRLRADWMWLVGALGLGFALYMMFFTTFFKFPKGPFEIYHETLEYWMGQNAQHRIHGPFHMHLLNMAIYETGPLLAMLAAFAGTFVAMRWSRTRATSLILAALALAAFHVLVFVRLETPMRYMAYACAVVALGGFAIMALPRLGRAVAPVLFGLFLLVSLGYFHGSSWNAFLTSVARGGGRELAWSGRQFLDDTLSLTSGIHLFIIAFLVLAGTVVAWRFLDRGDRFRGLLVWWLITMIGACSYAREKVPWVGIYITLPLVLLAGAYAQRIADRIVSGAGGRWKHVACGFALGAALLWGAKGSFNLCFVNYDDVRERMVFAHPPREVREHVAIVERALASASLRTESGPGGLAMWHSNYNAPNRTRSVRILVQNDTLHWPMRWYFRDTDWDQSYAGDGLANAGYDFMFLNADAREKHPGLAEKYILREGRVHMHWVARPLDREALLAAWQLAMPAHLQDREKAAAAASEWRKAWRYLMYREIPIDNGATGLSWVGYVFAERRQEAAPHTFDVQEFLEEDKEE